MVPVLAAAILQILPPMTMTFDTSDGTADGDPYSSNRERAGQ